MNEKIEKHNPEPDIRCVSLSPSLSWSLPLNLPTTRSLQLHSPCVLDSGQRGACSSLGILLAFVFVCVYVSVSATVSASVQLCLCIRVHTVAFLQHVRCIHAFIPSHIHARIHASNLIIICIGRVHQGVHQ